MPAAARPSHQQVREWMQQRQEAKQPPPSPEQIRRELSWGWPLVASKEPEQWEVTVTACTA